MKFLKLVLLLIFPLSSANAANNCQDENWQFKGTISKEISNYNEFAKAHLNKYLRSHGLPIQLGLGRVKGYPNRLESKDEGPGGSVAVVFLKAMKTSASSGLVFDSVYEFADETSTKPLHRWNVPFEDFPIAIEGNDLIVRTTLTGACGAQPLAITIAIQPGGAFRVINSIKTGEPVAIESDKCKANKEVFKDSAYGTCARFTDLKSKRKRTLAWQTPMT